MPDLFFSLHSADFIVLWALNYFGVRYFDTTGWLWLEYFTVVRKALGFRLKHPNHTVLNKYINLT